MKHRQHKRRFGRTTEHRQAMFRNMVTSLIQHERIETTHAKAKDVRRLAEQMVTLGKDGSLHARRQAAAVVRSEAAVRKLFDDLAERFKDRPGGYVRITPIGPRRGDGASMAVIEFVQEEYRPRRRRRRRRRSAGAATDEQAASPEAANANAAGDSDDDSTDTSPDDDDESS